MEQLLATKLYIPPARQEFVQRPRLLDKLNSGWRQNQGFGRKLTLVSAPAGYGKTTLLAEWVEGLRSYVDSCWNNLQPSTINLQPVVAWLSLDEDDNDTARFLTYFITALNRIEGSESSLGKGALDMLQSPQPPPSEAVLTSLINELAEINTRIILVLDDYHLIEAQPIHEALSFFLESTPPQIHLVIATREDPHLPLARLRARGQLTELRAADLRFTLPEAAEFLNRAMGLNLSEADIAALDSRTEGWIAGLQLAAISMQGSQDVSAFIASFTGSHHFVLDYLVTEILEQQPAGVEHFLLQTSILDQLNGSLCDAVRFENAISPYHSIGTAGSEETARDRQADSQTILEMLNRANLFIVPLDDERRWFRYHHLFADLLRRGLHQTHHEQIPMLHQRASAWYEQNGFPVEAIEHALRAKDFERAANLIEGQFGIVYERGDHSILRHWLAELPEELVCAKPHLSILHAWNLFTGGRLEDAARILQIAERLLNPNTEQSSGSRAEATPLSVIERKTLLGRVSAIWAFITSYRGDVTGTIQHARQALDYLPEQELPWRSAAVIALGDAYSNQGEMAAAYQARLEALALSKAMGDAYLLMIANLRLAETLRGMGELRRVVEICEQQMSAAAASGISETVVAGWLAGIWGETLAELNDLERALDLAKRGVDLTGNGRDVAMIGWSNLCLARVLFSRGDFTAAEALIQKMEKTALEYDMPVWVPIQFSAWQARICLAQGNLAAATQWIRERGLRAGDEPSYLYETEYIALARILIAQARLSDATALLQKLFTAAEAGERTARMIEISMLQSLVDQAGGDLEQALKKLEQALILAEPGGFVRIFVDEGPLLASLLYAAHTRSIARDYAHRLLTAFPVTEAEHPDPDKPLTARPGIFESLSEREIEVLQLINEGFTNPEIALRLYLTLNTVKVHTRNIYGKLGVNNRMQAVAQARALGILPSN